MKKHLATGVVIAVSCLNLQAQEKPNILFIFSDDHAVKAIGAYGSELSKLAPTPNLDRIANYGAVFENNLKMKFA